MNLIQSLVIAMSMYSKIPMPKVEWNEKNMKYAMCFFPLAGGIIGVCIWGIGTLLLTSSCGPLFFAGVMTMIPVLITGGIHMDGFMDTMDALSSYGEREKKLAILKDSHAGAFAILGLGCYLVWSLAVWSEVTVKMLPVIGAGFVLSRSMSGFSVMNFPSARKDGLGRTFQEQAHQKRVSKVMILYFLAATVVMLFFSPVQGGAALLAALIVFGYYRQMALKQFGGMTGDLAGYFLQLCELAMVTGVVLAGGALWR